MSYIFKGNSKYHIIQDLGDNLVNLDEKEECFEVDELLAYPVALLCNKGYLTDTCCAGHAFGSPFFELEESEEQLIYSEEDVFYMEVLEDYGQQNCKCIAGEPNPGAVINFKENHHFEEVPTGWTFENGSLFFRLPMQDNPSIYYQKLTDGIVVLTEWILKLPSYL